ncbi:hypothetical protein [Pantoea cypripedii]|uniref:Uncharacterized protein n=1 Tax=Pantoea cypripedii TaxID=55209 RepID=A0A1X1EG15_PANCY|nr:hypothetical protein [Pantoea cypripedii]MBP2199837.1 membrane protein YdbS with pleckstrin-like domain [Pantoea cypripedii]ORM87897.1 hypothetical protein HA50_28585 [Pantoea cypripedii]
MTIENELREKGFSEKDLIRLKQILSKPHNRGQTLSSLIIDLSKRFWGGIICMIVLAFVAVLGIFKDSAENTSAYVIVIVFGLVVVYFITPINLAWKARKYIASKR